VLHAVGVFPQWGASMVGFDGPLLLATVYRTVYGVLGSYIIARLAPDRPMQHALVGGFLGLVVSIVGAAVRWNKGPASASLVSACAHRARHAASLGWQQTPRDAVACTR
jgi:hypothetical protein